MGRPSKYQDAFAEQAFKLCLLGATDERLSNFFEVAESTISKWKLDYPEFSEALKRGRDEADAKVADSLYNKAIGWKTQETTRDAAGNERTVEKQHPPDTTAAIFWLKNRQRESWRDVKHNEHTVTHELSNEERLARLSRILGLEEPGEDRQPVTH
tara:strand:- start:994 stop:1461 length:468 start_codon:yes stop_codon:yes gene_type:complete